MSQQQWSARACPAFRRELADAYQARADRIRAMTGPHLPDWMLADGQRTIDADERAAWELRGVDLYWVTGEMARLAMDAALDMPEFDAQQLASPHGMIFFQRPLPAIQSQPCEIYTVGTCARHAHVRWMCAGRRRICTCRGREKAAPTRLGEGSSGCVDAAGTRCRRSAPYRALRRGAATRGL